MTDDFTVPWRAYPAGQHGIGGWVITSGNRLGYMAHGLTEEFSRHVTNLHNLSLLKPVIERATLDTHCGHPADQISADGLRCLSCGLLIGSGMK